LDLGYRDTVVAIHSDVGSCGLLGFLRQLGSMPVSWNQVVVSAVWGAGLGFLFAVGGAKLTRRFDVKTFVVMPWSISIDDSAQAGRLSIGYWFVCAGEIATARSKMHHLGGDWVMDSVIVDLKAERHELIAHQ
jgi:phosphate/sulfate permease